MHHWVHTQGAHSHLAFGLQWEGAERSEGLHTLTNDAKQRKANPAREAPLLPTADRCPSCGFAGAMHREIHNEMLDVGEDAFIAPVQVDVCDHPGEYVYDLRTVGERKALEARLRSGDRTRFVPKGVVYRPS